MTYSVLQHRSDTARRECLVSRGQAPCAHAHFFVEREVHRIVDVIIRIEVTIFNLLGALMWERLTKGSKRLRQLRKTERGSTGAACCCGGSAVGTHRTRQLAAWCQHASAEVTTADPTQVMRHHREARDDDACACALLLLCECVINTSVNKVTSFE